MSKTVKIAVASLVAYLAFSFLIPKLMSVSGSNYWILAGGLALIGILAAAAFVWFEARNQAATPKSLAGLGASGSAGASGDELSGLLNEAEERLRSSNLGRGARFASLPALFVIGPKGSTKTTTVVQSGLDPELLAGQVYQEGNVVSPTRFVNAWFARQWIFVEAGAAAMADANQWVKLIRRMRPGPLQGATRKGAQSPRAALLCFDCEEFLKPRGAEATAVAARELHGKIGAISQSLGISLPVYVLFTRADRIPYFLDYFRTLTNDESAQVLGATLDAGAGKGAYDQEQSARLNAAIDQLYFSLAEHRTDFLGREGDAEKLPGSYEFPREFRKFRNLVVQFLLDVCRPSQLNATPFLRGFYFSGVRPVMVRDAAPAPVVNRPREGDSGATGVFRVGPEPATAFAESSAVRKVPQWVFLRQMFGQVILADEAALGVSAVTVKSSPWKRAALASAAALGLLLSIAWITSFSQNRGLEASALDASAAVKLNNAAAAPTPVPSLDDLTKLDNLRQSVETIGRYNREGAPLSYRWGLYVGDDLYPKVRRLYFRRFFQLLFGSTQAGLLSNLQALPASPSPTDSYQYPYDSLKSYLITTSNHDKSTKLYLSPLLYSRWEAGKSVDPPRAQLVRRQFEFYSDELKFANPFSSENDSAAIDRARKYLAQFAGTERVYRFMLAEANKNAPSLNFNQKFPGSAQTVVNSRDVAGAFTKTGWPVMQDAIKHADRYFAGEQWVLGDQSANIGDRAKLEADLRNLYNNDYVDQWRDYLKKSVVVGYTSIQDAAKKLAVTASPQSPLLAMFCMASQQVGVDPDLAKSFKPLLAVVPASCGDQYVGGTNQDYMKSLLALQLSLGQITNPDPNDPNVAAAASNATAAKVVTGQMAQGFGVDPLAPTVQKLIEDPIAHVEPLVKGLGAAALNKGGKNLCADFRALMTKYPFNATSTNDATIADVNGIFKPQEGSMWKFYDQNLQRLLPKQGATYVPAPGGSVTLLSGFVNFFNRMAAFSNALYAGTTDPHFTYSLKPVQSEGIKSVTLNIDGQSLNSTGSAPAKQFTWPGSPQGVNAMVNYGGTDLGWQAFPGLWGVFRFFAAADKPAGSGTTSTVEWVMRSGTQVTKLPDGRPMTERIELNMGASPPVFQRGYFSSLTCVADVAR
ncbi:MAG TPA: ImcF-related family protein [Bryobacteraceae bacterium]|nr:ImcF-related family protein [Bryobacteraceae bacterium]